MNANPHQSCQTCTYWCPQRIPTIGACLALHGYYSHDEGRHCDKYDPLTDGAEVIRRGQAIMEAEHADQPPIG